MSPVFFAQTGRIASFPFPQRGLYAVPQELFGGLDARLPGIDRLQSGVFRQIDAGGQQVRRYKCSADDSLIRHCTSGHHRISSDQLKDSVQFSIKSISARSPDLSSAHL